MLLYVTSVRGTYTVYQLWTNFPLNQLRISTEKLCEWGWQNKMKQNQLKNYVIPLRTINICSNERLQEKVKTHKRVLTVTCEENGIIHSYLQQSTKTPALVHVSRFSRTLFTVSWNDPNKPACKISSKSKLLMRVVADNKSL